MWADAGLLVKYITSFIAIHMFNMDLLWTETSASPRLYKRSLNLRLLFRPNKKLEKIEPVASTSFMFVVRKFYFHSYWHVYMCHENQFYHMLVAEGAEET